MIEKKNISLIGSYLEFLDAGYRNHSKFLSRRHISALRDEVP